MLKLGYYNFEGNTVLYDGGDEAYDLDSRDWIPVELLVALGEFIGEDLDHLDDDDYSSNMACDDTGLCDFSCSRLLSGKCNGY